MAAEALALAGVIRARDGHIFDPEYQLTDILRRADRRCLLWRFPHDRGDAVEAGLWAEDLSEIWRTQTERILGGGGFRVRAWVPDLEPDACLSAVGQLMTPLAELHDAGWAQDWRTVPGRVIASVALLVPRHGVPHPWHWPLRVVTTGTDAVDPDQPAFARGLANLGPAADFYHMPDFVLHRSAPQDEVAAPPNVSGLKVQVVAPSEPEGAAYSARRLMDVYAHSKDVPIRPEALLVAPEDALPGFVTDYIYGLSHDAPPDVALFEAWLRLGPRPDTPVVLLAPAFGFDDDMENARLSARVVRAVADLGEQIARAPDLGAMPAISVSPRMAEAFRLEQSGDVPAADLHRALVENVLAGRIRFDHESDTGESLGNLVSEIDRIAPGPVTSLMMQPSPPAPHLALDSDAFNEVLQNAKVLGRAGAIVEDGEDIIPEAFEDELFELTATANDAQRAETDRYVDPVFYHGHYAAGDDPDPADIVSHDEDLEETSPYTLEIAIRAERIGIDRDGDAPAILQPPRDADETVTVYARVESLDDSLLRFEDGFLPIEWPFDSDSTPALFRCETQRGPRGRNVVDVEVLIYSADLHLLEVMTIRDIVIGDNPDGHVRHKHFPEDRPTALTPAAGEAPVGLSLRIKGAPLGYTAEAIFRVGPDRLRPIPLGRTIPADDIRALLVRIRDFWTELVVGDLSVKDRLLAYKYRKCLTEMWRFGGMAWRLFFGNDRDGGGAALGDLIGALDLPPDSLIQITCRDDARHFAFPWALMRPDPYPGDAPEPDAFWGLRFVVEQLTRKGARDLRLSDAPVNVASVIDPGFAGVVPHRETLETALAGNRLGALSTLTTQTDLQESLSSPQPAQLYYFFCQGFTPGENPKLAADSIKMLRDLAQSSEAQAVWDTLLNRLDVVPGEAKMFFGTASLTETELNEIDFFQGRSRPIVFLNMCHSADLLPAMGHGLTRRFIERNASAVVGTECPMTAVFADLFAARVLAALADHQPVGQVILDARRHFHTERNPLGLAYTLYGRSDARLGPAPGPDVQRKEEH